MSRYSKPIKCELYILNDPDYGDILVEDVCFVVEYLPSDKPYYSIRYKAMNDGRIHIGYSSYTLEIVVDFFHEYFHRVDSVSSKDCRYRVEM